jgi:hypothetical protein
MSEMKSTIDGIVSQIYAALNEGDEPQDQVAALLGQLKLHGLSKAVELRGVLASYTELVDISDDDRAYAEQKLNELPPF